MEEGLWLGKLRREDGSTTASNKLLPLLLSYFLHSGSSFDLIIHIVHLFVLPTLDSSFPGCQADGSA